MQQLIDRLASVSLGGWDLTQRLNVARPDEVGVVAEEVALVLGQIQTETLHVGRLLTTASSKVFRQSESVGLAASGVHSLSESTQQAAGSAEGLAEASSDSSAKIDRLQSLISSFKPQ